MRHLFLILFLGIFFSLSAQTFSPQSGTPIGDGVHPRLLITPDNLPDLRVALSGYLWNYYQDYVNWAANANDNDNTNILYEAGHDPVRALMLHQAFIAAVGQVNGVSYPIPLQKYAQRAIDRLIARLNAGDKLSFVAALTYDWTYNYQTTSQRQQIANIMDTRLLTHKVFSLTLRNPDFKAEQMFSSKYYEVFQPWFLGLALYGDGLVDADAQKSVNTFYNTMLKNGYLDAENFVAGNTGGWSEWIGYSSWHPRSHMLNVFAWFTATGEDYITNSGDMPGNALKNYPVYMRYAMDPHKYYNSFFSYVRTGDAEATDPSFRHRSMREQIYLLTGALQQAGLNDQAGLLRDMIEKYNVTWPSYKHYFLYGLLSKFKSIPAKSPLELGLKHSLWARNTGIFFARTGFENPADGVFAAMDGHFRYDGHKGAFDKPGFLLNKFGPLVNTRHVAHRGYGNLSTYPDGYEDNVVFFNNGHLRSSLHYIKYPAQLADAASGAGDYDYGGLEEVVRKDGYFYYVRSNRDRLFIDGASHQRDYLFLPGDNPNNDSDFLVVYDRVSAPSKSRWIYHVPWKPDVSGYVSTQNITTGSGTGDRIGDNYIGSNILVRESNRLGGEKDNDGGTKDYTNGVDVGAHGVAFVKTLLPKQINVEVSRVARFDGNVIKRQHELAIKTGRWQVAVIPQQYNTSERYLNVFQAADVFNVNAMTPTTLIEVGSSMQGVFIKRENTGRPNYVVLFNKNNSINTTAITYDVSGTGTLRHVITGLEAHTTYQIEDVVGSNSNTSSKVTEPDISIWDYKGQATNVQTGVLYFESTLTGNHRFKITKSGQQDTTPPSRPSGVKVKS